MPSTGYTRVRRTQLLLAGATGLVLLLWARPGWLVGPAALALGLAAGYPLGRWAWGRARPRVDRRNVLILYLGDAPFYLLLVAVFLAKSFPLGAGRMAWLALKHPDAFVAIVLAVAAAWFGYDLAYLLGVTRHERDHGPIRIRAFSSRSVTGQQGMIGLRGRVTRACEPRGKVSVHGEIWDAASIDGEPIPAGAEVVVRDIDEMELIVEPQTPIT